jgi:hypothetical protein
MKEFLLLYRGDYSVIPQVPQEQLQATTKKWMDWMGSIAAQNKLADKGNRLNTSGRVLKPNNVVTDGPYSEIKESIGGYSIIKVDSYDEAVNLAKSCPILAFGGNVEIREVNPI